MPKKRRYWNPRANQRINPKTGKFMRKVGTKPLTPALPASASLMECLASLSTPMAVAKRILRLARSGDGSALALQIQALNHHRPDLGEGYDTSKLSEAQLRMLLALLKLAKGEAIPDSEILESARAVVAELDPGPVYLPDDDQEDETLTPPVIPAPEPLPAPTPRATPKRLILGRYSEEELERAKPSSGFGTHRSMLNIHNNQPAYDPPEERNYDPKDLASAFTEVEELPCNRRRTN